VTGAQAAVALAILALAFLAWFWLAPEGVLALRRRAGGELPVDVRTGYGPATLYRLLELYGPDGRAGFRRMLLIDMAFPLVYGTLLYLLAALLGAPQRPVAAVAQEAAVLAALCDYAENTLLLGVLERFPRRADRRARLAGLATTVKMLAFVLAVIALLLAWIAPY
jgi:hypothetical protein